MSNQRKNKMFDIDRLFLYFFILSQARCDINYEEPSWTKVSFVIHPIHTTLLSRGVLSQGNLSCCYYVGSILVGYGSVWLLRWKPKVPKWNCCLSGSSVYIQTLDSDYNWQSYDRKTDFKLNCNKPLKGMALTSLRIAL